MDAMTALWLASIAGAAGFAATGYVFGRARTAEERAAAPVPAPAPEKEPDVAPEPEPAPEPVTAADDEALARTRAELEDANQKLAALREELRLEVVARADAEKRASDLMQRLVSSSQQVAALRAKVAGTDDAARRPSLTPPAPRTSERPAAARLATLAPGLFSEIEDLRREVATLRAENESLRVAAFTRKPAD